MKERLPLKHTWQTLPSCFRCFVWVHHCRLIILERQVLCILYIFAALILAQEIRLGGGIHRFNGFAVIAVFGWLNCQHQYVAWLNAFQYMKTIVEMSWYQRKLIYWILMYTYTVTHVLYKLQPYHTHRWLLPWPIFSFSVQVILFEFKDRKLSSHFERSVFFFFRN